MTGHILSMLGLSPWKAGRVEVGEQRWAPPPAPRSPRHLRGAGRRAVIRAAGPVLCPAPAARCA